MRDVFIKQMGLTEQDIVALSGGHTLVCLTFIHGGGLYFLHALIVVNALAFYKLV